MSEIKVQNKPKDFVKVEGHGQVKRGTYIWKVIPGKGKVKVLVP